MRLDLSNKTRLRLGSKDSLDTQMGYVIRLGMGKDHDLGLTNRSTLKQQKCAIIEK